MSKYVIITENDESQWDDEEGARYHFPSKYIRLLKPGANVIYYKGKMTNKSFKEKRLSSDPHYFGKAVIGTVSQDPENHKNYFSEIEDYEKFQYPVYFKDEDGRYIEKVSRSNHFRDGVRESSLDVFEEIYRRAKISEKLTDQQGKEIDDQDFTITKAEEDLLIGYKKKQKAGTGTQTKVYYPTNTKKWGDRGEKIVLEYLKDQLSPEEVSTLRWLADIGETPGYDIEYVDKNGKKHCIEVKSTTAKKFPYFNFTSNEMIVAKQERNYFIFLVSEVSSVSPKIQIIADPFNSDNNGKWKVEAAAYKVYKLDD